MICLGNMMLGKWSIMLDKQKLFDEVESTYWDCFEPNWDGYGANAVSRKTFVSARDFVMQLPDDVALPSLAAEPSGAICFEWYVSKGNSFIVAVDENHKISVAGIGDYYICKELNWYDVIPDEILVLIKKVPEDTDSG